MNITFQKAVSSDSFAISELFYHSIYVRAGQPRPDRSIVDKPELKKYYSGWGHESDIGIIAYSDNKPVGAAWIRLLNGENRGFGFVDDVTPELSIAVLPEYRNQGIGTNLIQRIIEAAKGLYARISLSVSRGNPAYRLYLRAGFSQAAENEQDFIMIKDLCETRLKGSAAFVGDIISPIEDEWI